MGLLPGLFRLRRKRIMIINLRFITHPRGTFDGVLSRIQGCRNPVWTFASLNQCIPVSFEQGSVLIGSIKVGLKDTYEGPIVWRGTPAVVHRYAPTGTSPASRASQNTRGSPNSYKGARVLTPPLLAVLTDGALTIRSEIKPVSTC